MPYYYFEPEVAGGLGARTEADTSVHPPRVSKLHYVLEGWLGDDIIESFPCFVVTERLKKALEQAGLSGFNFDDVVVTTSPEFDELYAGRDLPSFFWLRISGKSGSDDFGLARDHRLVVSQRALALFEKFNITNADLEDY